MACSRGKANPDSTTKYRLFADSGGYCQKPDCNSELFKDLATDHIHIAEIAHIIAAANKGPRANASLTNAERNSYQNLILLCPTCHTEIDKAPQDYTDSIVLGWKSSHKEVLKRIFGVTKFESRDALRLSISPLLDANASIHRLYGPESREAVSPEDDMPKTWKRKVLSSIIPTNQRILAYLDINRHLLTQDERQTLEEFRQHIDDLTRRHLDPIRFGGGARFPKEMTTIGSDEESK